MANNINKRVKIGRIDEMILYEQVNGLCPVCGKPLLYEKAKKEKGFEIAHIYPLNPTSKEVILLQDEEKLHEDLNHIDNLILLCANCHTQFDKPKTIESYRKMVNCKKKLIQRGKIYSLFNSYTIEEEINNILELLSTGGSEINNTKLEYKALKVSDKVDNTLLALTKRDIENDVVDYYELTKQKFVELDKDNPGTFELIASQVKTFYLQTKKTSNNQEIIFNSIVEWLNKKTGSYSVIACRIIVSFFVQDCEVFS